MLEGTTPLTMKDDPYIAIQQATREHRRQHNCEAYTFEDGPSLIRLSMQIQPRRVLELGTALGYTACCMAHGSALTHVDTIEGDAQHALLAQQQILQHGLSERITVHSGWFEDVLPRLNTGYSMAFFDGFAPSPSIIQRLHDLLAPEGILVCSNLQLAHGQDARELSTDLENTRRWKPLPAIEHGHTRVLEKVSAPA